MKGVVLEKTISVSPIQDIPFFCEKNLLPRPESLFFVSQIMCNPRGRIPFLKFTIIYYHPFYIYVFQIISFPEFTPQISSKQFSSFAGLLHALPISTPSPVHTNNNWRKQTVEIRIPRLSEASSHVLAVCSTNCDTASHPSQMLSFRQ